MEVTKIQKIISQLIFKKGGHTFFFRIFGMIFNFVITLYITNIYGSSSYGLFALSLTILQLMVMFFSFGIPAAFISFTGAFSSIDLNKGLLIKSYKIIFLLSIIPIVLLYFNANHIAGFFNKLPLTNFLKVAFLSLIFLVFHEINSNYFLSIKKFFWFGIVYFIIPNILFLISILFFKFNNFPDYFIIFSYSLSIFITVIISLFLIFRNKKYLTVTIKSKEILMRSLPMMASGFFLVLLNWTDVLMLGKYETERNIGVYNAAFKIGYLTLFFVMSMGSIIIADISEHFNNKNFKALHFTIKKATQITAVLTLPLAIFILVFSEYLLGLFGAEFIEGKTALIFITIGALYNAMTGNVDQLLNMTGHQITVRNIMFAGFVINVFLNLFLIPLYGINGAALSSLIVNIIVNTIFVFIIKKKFGFYTFM
jgi:O-antigen/teichoic acid export membrane protein